MRSYQVPMGNALKLSQYGPLVVGKLRPSLAAVSEMYALGLTPIFAAPVQFVIDTGAATSMIEISVARHLGLESERTVDLRGIAKNVVRCPLYSATLELGFKDEDGYEAMMPVPIALAGLESAPSNHYSGLIGRDFLMHFDLAYSGPTGEFALRTDHEWSYG